MPRDERSAEQMRHDGGAEWVAVDHIGAIINGPFETEQEALDSLVGTYAEDTGFAEPARWHDMEEGGTW